MKIKKILFIILIVFFSNIFTDCCNELDYIKLESLKITPIEKLQFSTNQIHKNDSVKTSNFGIRIGFNVSYYSILQGFTNTMYATQPCNNGGKGSKETIIELSIKSNSDIDKNHLAGKDLKELFVYKQNLFLNNQHNMDTSYKSIDANYYKLLQMGFEELLLLDVNKLSNGESMIPSIHKFTIYAKLSDGREFVKSTFPIKFSY